MITLNITNELRKIRQDVEQELKDLVISKVNTIMTNIKKSLIDEIEEEIKSLKLDITNNIEVLTEEVLTEEVLTEEVLTEEGKYGDIIVDNFSIQTLFLNGEVWYSTADLAIFLDIKNIRSTCSTQLQNNDKILHEAPNKKKKIIFVNTTGLTKIILTSRKPNSIKLAKYFNIPILYKIIPMETSIVNNIQKAFINETILLQFNVDNFVIDLYFPDYNLAIEIDENHHKYQKNDDIKRQDKISKILKCEFIRISENDDIFDIINIIYTKITI